MTFAAWVYRNNITGSAWVMHQWSTTGPALFFSGATLYWEVGSVAVSVASAIPANTWSHVAGVLSGTTLSIYINGVLRTSSSVAITYRTTVIFGIGGPNGLGGVSSMSGMIDDARVWNSALTAAQISQVYSTGDNPSTPLSWWKFNDGSGVTAVDSGSGGNNGDLTGHAPTWTTTHQPFCATKSRATSTDLLTGLGSTTVNSFLSTIGKKPGGGQGKLQFSSDNATWKNANGDLVDNAGGYSFDGVNDVISMGNVLNWTWNAPNSISLWFKTTTTSSLILISKRESGSNYRGYEIQINNTVTGRIRFVLCNVTLTNQLSIDADTTANDGNWHHLVAVTTNGTAAGASLYLDGVPLTTSIGHNSLTGVITNTIPFQIGARNSTLFFPGSIDDVRVYDFAVSASEVESLYQRHEPTTTTPVGWWKLDGNANDSGSGGNNGTVSGATSVTDWWELPQFGEPISDDNDVLSFDGVNDEITNATADYRSADSLGSVTAWVWVNALGTAQSILSSADTASTTRFWTLEIGTTGKLAIRQNDNGTASSITSTNVLAVGRWYHVAVTSSGTAYVLYINGVAETLIVAAGSNDGDWFADTSARDNVTIGSLKTSSTSQYFGGRIANVSVYSTQLSAATILADFQNGYPSSTNRVTNFPMNEGTGNVTDSDGALTGTVSGATWIKDIARPQPTTPAQQTLSLSLLSFTSAVYYRALYSEIVADRAMALAEVTVDYTAGGLKRHPRMNARMAEMSGGLV